MNTKILTAPNGSLIRAAHIVSVSPLFESPDLGTDAFAVYTIGDNSDPFVFAAPDTYVRPVTAKMAAERKKETAKLHKAFIDAWIVSLDGSPYFKN